MVYKVGRDDVSFLGISWLMYVALETRYFVIEPETAMPLLTLFHQPHHSRFLDDDSPRSKRSGDYDGTHDNELFMFL